MRRKITGRELFVVSLSAAAFVLVGGCTKERKDVVVVDRTAETISHHRLSEAPIGLQMQSKLTEGAITTWFFHCSNRFDYEISSETFEQGIGSVRVVITGAHGRIGLEVDVFTKEDAPDYLKQHEDGHARICQLIYRGADKIAYEAAYAVIGKTFEGKGASHKQAMEEALNKASEAVCSVYRRKTVELANRYSKRYDDISNHGHASIAVDDAIARAVQQDKKQ